MYLPPKPEALCHGLKRHMAIILSLRSIDTFLSTNPSQDRVTTLQYVFCTYVQPKADPYDVLVVLKSPASSLPDDPISIAADCDRQYATRLFLLYGGRAEVGDYHSLLNEPPTVVCTRNF